MTTPDLPPEPGYKSTEDYVDPGERINAMFDEGFGDMRKRGISPELIILAQGGTPDGYDHLGQKKEIETEDEG
jgi:hypothetical protein|tara:strand:- start:17 stop:235 length:219 start_codon:yes stop_codon:yes gene_type:complete